MNKIKPRHADKNELLSRITCVDAAALLGLRTVQKNGKLYLECPFHESILGKPDRNIGNCVSRQEDGYATCHCFACGGTGNPIRMTMAALSLDFCAATDYLAKCLAPDLLEERAFPERNDRGGKGYKPRRFFPYSRSDMQFIGLHTSDVLFSPVTECSSRMDGEIVRSYEQVTGHAYPWDMNDPDPTAESRTEYYLCEQVNDSLGDLYNEDKEMFFSITCGKAEEFAGLLKQRLALIRKTLPKGKARSVMEFELKKAIDRAESILERLTEDWEDMVPA